MEILFLLLGIAGLFGAGALVQFYNNTIGRWWFLRTWNKERVQQEVRKIAFRHIISFVGPKDASTYGPPILVNNFIDFLSATTCARERALLERCATRWIRLTFTRVPDVVAVPKLGNVLFADSVAKRLGRPLVIVRQDTEHMVRGGHPLDGQVQAGNRVLLVDDIASDGDFLVRACHPIQEMQASLIGVMCLLNRPEGDAGIKLSAARLPFAFILELSDDEISAAVEECTPRKPSN